MYSERTYDLNETLFSSWLHSVAPYGALIHENPTNEWEVRRWKVRNPATHDRLCSVVMYKNKKGRWSIVSERLGLLRAFHRGDKTFNFYGET